MSETTPRPRRSKAKNTFTTKSGKTIKINRSLNERVKANKEAKARRKAAYLSTLPKEKWKRILYRLHPKRVLKYWFSREGAIMAIKITGIGLVVVFLLIVGLFAYFRKDLPKIKDISGSNFGGSITYYDSTGKTILWQDYDAVKRQPVASGDIAKYMKDATVAIEDKDFYKHGAFDVRGIVRAGVNDAKGGSTQGGSTITQQLVKLNEGWTNDHTISRKVKELILAVELEREYNKDDVLTGYLNIAPYGNVDYGVEAASRDYFNIDASQLSLAQSAMLASIPKAPTAYSPFSSPTFNPSATADYFSQDDLISRQHYVLDQMAKQGYITQAQADTAKKVDILAQVKPLESKYSAIKAPYFVLSAKQELENKFGSTLVKRGGWKVTTTLDLTLQTKAEQLVASNLPYIQRISGGKADEEATVLEDVQTGQIKALVGGVDFTNKQYGQNNYASGILIPPGSSFKPYDYATLIDNNTNVGAGSVLYDQDGPLPANGYECTNKALPKNGGNCLKDYDFLQPGPLTLRYALGGSRNVPAVKAMLSAVPNDASSNKVNSINKVISTASAMMDNTYVQQQAKKPYNCYSDEQNTQTTQCYASSAIGDGAFLHLDDHVNGLSTLARLGSAIPRTYLLNVITADNKSILKWSQPKSTQILKPDSAYIVDDMASDPNASYLPGTCSATNCTSYKFHRYNGWHFAIKTGTTNNGYDGLMTSWSTKYAVVSWVGNHDRNIDFTSAVYSAEYFTEPLTKGLMEAAHAGLPAVNWTKPADIKTLPAYVVTKHIDHGDIEPSPSNDLFPSWYTPKTSTATSATTDKVSGKVATTCTPELAKQTITNGNANIWNVDIFVGGSTSNTATPTTNAATAATDDVHVCGEAQPTIQVTAVNGVAVTSGTPSSCPTNSSTAGCDIKVLVQQGAHALTDPAYPDNPGTINLLINNQVVDTLPISASGNYDFNYKPATGTSGTVQFSVQVIDSVLYSANDTGSVTFVGGATTSALKQNNTIPIRTAVAHAGP